MQDLVAYIVDAESLSQSADGPLDVSGNNEILFNAVRERQALLDDPSFVSRYNSGDKDAYEKMTALNGAIGIAQERAATATEFTNVEAGLAQTRSKIGWTPGGSYGDTFDPGAGSEGGNET